eukprot:jgi/Chlat1/678/Chrsp104S01150
MSKQQGQVMKQFDRLKSRASKLVSKATRIVDEGAVRSPFQRTQSSTRSGNSTTSPSTSQRTSEDSTDSPSDGLVSARVRSEWVKGQLRKSRHRFTESREFTLFVGTWNVNGRPPDPDTPLHEWLGPGEDADLVVIGFQEIVPIDTRNVLVVEDAKITAVWESHIDKCLNRQWTPSNRSMRKEPSQSFTGQGSDGGINGHAEPASAPDAADVGNTNSGADTQALEQPESSSDSSAYAIIVSKQMVGLHICVWAKSTLRPYVQDVQTAAVGCGVLGMLGNKGGVSARMRVYSNTFCFVCVHLSSGEGEAVDRRRNSDYSEIMRRTTFPATASHAPVSILDHDTVVWLGDLNYRLNLSDDEIRDGIKHKAWDQLLRGDQLTTERQAGRAFHKLKEGNIMFAPTYKYILGTQQYTGKAAAEERLVRSPAWCDRILWQGERLSQRRYDRAELLSSDHRPVWSVFNAQAEEVVQSRMEAILAELRHELDNMEMQAQPKCQIHPSAVDFGAVKYGAFAEATVTVTNAGSVPAYFNFLQPPGELAVCPSWLTVMPMEGQLGVGEEVQLTLTALVDTSNGSVQPLVTHQGNMDAILILHIEQGADFFLSCTGKYQISCWGLTLEQMVRHREPARALTLHRMPSNMSPEPVEPEVPKELLRMTTFVTSKAKEDGGSSLAQALNALSGSGTDVVGHDTEGKSAVASIREALDTGAELQEGTTVLAMVATLLSFFASLASPLFPQAIGDVCEVCVPSRDMANTLLQRTLTPEHFAVLEHVRQFLKDVVKCTARHSMSHLTIAALFADVCFQTIERGGAWHRRVEFVQQMFE